MTDWATLAACRDLPAEMLDVYYPARGGSASQAAAICATCPVVRECITDDLSKTRVHYASAGGVRGGIGGSGRRALLVAMRDLDHPPKRTCSDPECAWCELMRAHLTNLAVIAGNQPPEARVRIESNGDGATHGRASTHARGCRCGPCRLARSVIGGRLTRSGMDCVTFWEVVWPADDGSWATTDLWTELDEARAEWMLERAKTMAKRWLAPELVAS